jgi:hypothetical protein
MISLNGIQKKSPGDRALFEMGILFAYPDNPKETFPGRLDILNGL